MWREVCAVASGCLPTGRRLWAFEGVSAIFEQGVGDASYNLGY